MIRLARILVLNNYRLDQVWEEVRRGQKPDHHLYGLPQLQALGYEIRVIAADTSRLLSALARMLRWARNPIPMGALDRQWSAWRTFHEGDLIYAPCGDELNALAYLRSAGIVKTPMIGLQHHALNRGRLASLREPWLRMLTSGVDEFPALSRLAAAQINERRAPHLPPSEPLAWGPDASFYPVSQSPGEGVIAAGRTGRDFITFGRAASRAGIAAKIFCLDHDAPALLSGLGSNVEVRAAPASCPYDYPEMMGEHLAARVVAIPLHASTSNLAGLTSLVDAMALGKPVVMTRNPFIDVDIEAEGFGRWVEPGDVDGWTDALTWFHRHPDESLAMGRRARQLVDEGRFSSDAFAQRIADLCARTLNRSAPGRPAPAP